MRGTARSPAQAVWNRLVGTGFLVPEVSATMSTRNYRPRRSGGGDRRGLPPVRDLQVRRRELFEEETEADTLEFVEEYDASGHHLRLERLPR